MGTYAQERASLSDYNGTDDMFGSSCTILASGPIPCVTNAHMLERMMTLGPFENQIRSAYFRFTRADLATYQIKNGTTIIYGGRKFQVSGITDNVKNDYAVAQTSLQQ